MSDRRNIDQITRELTELTGLERLVGRDALGDFRFLVNILMPTGAIMEYAGATSPDGFLLCQGQAVSRTAYSVLFGVISTTFGVGDGSTTFNVPDFREAAPVGVGTRASGVVANDVYTLGQFKDDQGQGHVHAQRGAGSGSGNDFLRQSLDSVANATSTTGVPSTDGTNGDPRTGTTTRGKRLGINFIIKI